MWRSWSNSYSSPKKSFSQSQTSSPCSSSSSSSSSSIFRCSSFKDIETLCLDPPQHQHQHQQPPTGFGPGPNKHHHPQHQQQQPPYPSTPRRSIFHRVRTANALLRQWGPSTTTTRSIEPPKPKPQPQPDNPDYEQGRIVVYCTSLRVVRPTFEACRAVQSILQGFRVTVEERDVAMDSSFMSELRERLPAGEKLTLPRVFVSGKYVGGADEVLQLHEIGELKKLVQGLPQAPPGTCDACGGFRFILCDQCSGSHKIFSEKLGALRSCTACNENGLIRCSRCCSPSPSRRILALRNGF